MKRSMENGIADIPFYQGGGPRDLFSCNNGCQMLRVTGTARLEYEAYIATLENAGFVLYSKHAIKENLFATYQGKSVIIQANYTDCDHISRIIADPNTILYKREEDTVSPKRCDTTLYQMELDYRTIDCGMCYILQCKDGSFFLIDSAHMNSTNDHKRLYDLLCRLVPEGQKIVIAGWFFSHAHQDHIVKFMDFIRSGFDNYEIKCLYFNFPELNVPGSEEWSASDKQTMLEFDELIKSHNELPVVKLHTGQHFFVCNLEFEVLSTHEDIYPGSLACFNDSSTVLLMTAEGCKTIFLGDANFTECNILIARYGDYLKSQIVQVAHHGYNSDNIEIYRHIAAQVALYPTSPSRYEDTKDSRSNQLIRELTKEIYLSGNGTTALRLPYQNHSAVTFPKEIF
ncbi:MAG TPA: hypothetical protein VHR42_07180 [Clostridia bacterium]|nr:hypothetical protein [Clostridia bacterium]